jgi:hypothetical protein
MAAFFATVDISQGEGMVYANAATQTFRKVICNNNNYGKCTRQQQRWGKVNLTIASPTAGNLSSSHLFQPMLDGCFWTADVRVLVYLSCRCGNHQAVGLGFDSMPGLP